MRVFIWYLVIGIVLNYGSIFAVWGYLMKLCRGNNYKYNQLYKKHTKKAYDVSAGYPRWLRFIFTQILWPINVFNTFYCGLQAIKEAKEDDQRR